MDKSYKITLPPALFGCPKYWTNFIKYTRTEIDSFSHVTNTMKKYNCIWFLQPCASGAVIEFESAEDATAFILRWS
jgi:hypothetical protein